MIGFREIKHTADIGLDISADTIENLFGFALSGYYKLVLSDDYSYKAVKDFSYTADEEDCENLLISFLSEINFLLMVKYQIIKSVRSIKIDKKDNRYVMVFKSKLTTLTNPGTDIETEIKAVTYHQLKIAEENGIFKTKIFFDT